MSLTYHQLRERSLVRIAGLSDGVFAFAMTLIVFEVQVPDPGPISSEGQLASALAALAPRFVTYLLSLLTLGIAWNAQQTFLQYVGTADRAFTWLQLAMLAVVTMYPFSTSLLAEFITFRLALAVYWLNIVLFGITFFWGVAYASKARLLTDDAPRGLFAVIRRRVVVAQSLYAFGALLAVFSTYLSIAFIVLAQLYYALALGPRIPLLRRTVIGRS
ncbi:MAG TPA: TMEM175 family protein [Candidatus Acidoferrales bacterium]|nr:TMEM175 family protein [Candidatus Acidoferrales bacterium]